VVLVVPLAPLEVHSIAVDPVFWLLLDVRGLFIVLYAVLKGKAIYGNEVVTRIILQSRGQEGLGEEEPGDPEDGGRAAFDPICEEVNAVIQVLDPRGEGLKGEEPFL